jgi:threonine synthase
MTAICLACERCEKVYPAQEIRYTCECGGLLDLSHDLEELRGRVSRALFDQRLAAPPATHNPFTPFDPLTASGVWRYRELILPVEAGRIVSRPEGNTACYHNPRLSRWVGLEGLYLKHEGENPSGSFKDRGMTVGITQARLLGARAVACASTGNTSASLACYAALAGIRAILFVPARHLAFGKLAQALAYGACTLQINGDFDAAMSLVRRACEELDIYLLNSINPFRVEGQKSIVFELVQQWGWSAPDWIVLPAGNLGNTAAFGKALHELAALGLIDKVPRLASVQAQGANPFYRSYRDGFRRLEPLHAETVATAIKIGAPVSFARAVRALRWTNGLVTEVSDQEILDAKAQVDAAGIGCEPASAAAVAGVRRLVGEGVIGPGDTVVAILTGHILKDPGTTVDYHLGKLEKGEMGVKPSYANRPIAVEPNMAAVRKALESLVRQ